MGRMSDVEIDVRTVRGTIEVIVHALARVWSCQRKEKTEGRAGVTHDRIRGAFRPGKAVAPTRETLSEAHKREY